MHIYLCESFLVYMHLSFHFPCMPTCTCIGLWCIGCVCVCFWQAVGKPAEQSEKSEVLNPIHPFEPRPQEQHLSPTAFHTLITRMLSLISLLVWNLSPSVVAPQFTDGRMPIAGFFASQKLVTVIRWVSLTVGSVLPCSSSIVRFTSESSHIEYTGFLFRHLVLSGGWNCSICAKTSSILSEKLCMFSVISMPCQGRLSVYMHACSIIFLISSSRCWESADYMSMRDLLVMPGKVYVCECLCTVCMYVCWKSGIDYVCRGV